VGSPHVYVDFLPFLFCSFFILGGVKMSGQNFFLVVIFACLIAAFVYVNFIFPKKNNNDKDEK
jgi:hypothetical protein